MDPNRFSLIKEHDKHFQVHDSKDNTHFNIAKKDVHPATQMKIMKLQKFSSGGDVGNDTEARLRSDYTGADRIQEPNAVTDPNQPAASPDTSPAPVAQDGPMSVGQATPPGQAPSAVDAEMTGAPNAAMTKVPQDAMQQFQNNQGLEEKGLQAKGQAEANLGNETSGIYKTAQDNMKDFVYQTQQAAFNQNVENENLAQEVANTKIDPKNYQHSMSTGAKIGNAIALMVGGIGAGLTHGPNLAYQSMQKAIEDDISAQKDNLGKKQSLLSTNLAKYKDMRMAEQATMMQMNAMTQGQIAQAQAKYGGQIGQAGTEAALGQLKNDNMQKGMALQQMVLQNKIQQHLAGGDVSKDNPLDYVKWTVPPEKQKDVADEIGKAQYVTQNHDQMMKLWDKAQQEQTMMRTGMGVFDAPATRALRAMGDPLIHDQVGRVNDFEKKDFEGLLPSSGQSDSRQKELRSGFEQFVNNKKQAPLAKSYGIDIGRFGSTATAPQSNQVERVVNNGPDKGKIAIYDGNKNFMGFKK